jgi:catechol 2,3-dioxygenase-like lactoylglutathione lyase family enzyme
MDMIKDFDHVVLTTADLDKCLDFYTRVLGMRVERYRTEGARGAERIALRFGDRKFNVHPPGFDANLKADKPTPGSLDFCFLADRPITEVIEHLKACNVTIIDGPGKRTGARFDLRSVYVRDPDNNLVEIAEPYNA